MGPSQLYPTVGQHLARAVKTNIGSLSHRSKGFEKIYQSACINLRDLLGIPRSHRIFFLSSSLEAMERTIQNTVEKTSLHIITGDFAKKFSETATQLGKSPTNVSFTPENVAAVPSLTMAKHTELLCVTQNETSTGIALMPETIYSLKNQHPSLLLALDVVSSVPYQKLNFRFIDIAFFSVQKGFGLPAGLSVLIVSPEALEKAIKLRKKGLIIGTYHSFPSLLEKAEKNQTPETPNVIDLYLLAKVSEDLLRVGVSVIRKETKEKAKMLYNFFDQSASYAPCVADPKYRSYTTLVIDTKGKSLQVLDRLQKSGIVVSSGYGKNQTTQIRIANFPVHTRQQVKQLISALDKALPSTP